MLRNNTFLPTTKELILNSSTLDDFTKPRQELQDGSKKYSIVSFISHYCESYKSTGVIDDIKNDFLRHKVFSSYSKQELENQDPLRLITNGVIAKEPHLTYTEVKDFYHDLINQLHIFHLAFASSQIIESIGFYASEASLEVLNIDKPKISAKEKEILDKLIEKCDEYFEQSKKLNTIFNEDVITPIIDNWEKALIELDEKFKTFLKVDLI